ncbi:amidohydrolase [Novosphingobium sp.]|uniref:amidohydrolase n=1 Tax=Novosphingobium sp. TaxID=1874826 RepID=UPI001ED69C41|nr:amidohydrolase [Novosphingobium sp.]MBK9010046.1 amidohydrolase [Novosphingobium sp.]
MMMGYRIAQFTLAGALVLGAAAVAQARPTQEVPTLWHGGTILTMDGETPRTVQAVVTRGGKIVFTGTQKQARRVAGRNAQTRNLKGATLLPGFIDAHSHFALALQAAGGIDLSDPANGEVRNIPTLLTAVKRAAEQRGIAKGDWVVVWGYDQENLDEARHITRAEIDAVLPDHKVALLHVSFHGLIANSAALAAAGLKDGAPVPEGGVMTSGPDGKLTGLLFERAMYPVAGLMPRPDQQGMLAAIEAAQLRYAREGYTQMQEGASQPNDIAFFTSPAAKQRLKLDLAMLPVFTGLDPLLADKTVQFGTWQGRVKLQGIKFILDGSPQARTAYFTRDYARGAPDGSHPWHGQPVTSEAEFLTTARKAHQRGWQLFVHANGDAAIDMAIKTFDTLGITAAGNRRPVVIHSQFMRPDQIPQYKRIGVGPAYFSNHTYYWGDVHRTNFPDEVVGYISPLKASKQAGLIPSNHTDYPVTRLDTRMMLWTAMARTSKTGVVSGADQRIGAYEALQALTTGPAWQAFEENRRGRIKPGLLADFVVLEKNPLTTPVTGIRDIKVLETVKEGQTVWKAE